MPMLLRSRKSIRSGSGAQGDDEELPEPPSASARRYSTRPHTRITYEDSGHSGSESVDSNQDMESDRSHSAEEADETVIKYCSVTLNRVQMDDKAIEEREDVNSKGGKTASRIPTYHKRPSGASQVSELPVLKKETSVQGDQPSEKAEASQAEASKSKLPDVKETALPLPSVRIPKFGIEAPSPLAGAKPAHSSLITAPKSWSLSGSNYNPLGAVSPRPAIRPELGSEQQLPEDYREKTSIIEADVLDSSLAQIPHEDALNQKPEESPAEYESEGEDETPVAISTNPEISESEEMVLPAEVRQVDDIMKEKAPWEEKEQENVLESKDSGSSSSAESEEDVTEEKSDLQIPEGEKPEQPEAQSVESEFSIPQEKMDMLKKPAAPVAAEMSKAKVSSTKSAKSSGCSSFVLYFLIPTTVLLLGGFSQHIWHYGLPRSVAELTAQMELHWLEGFGLDPQPCSTDCRVHLVESIPVGLYPSAPPSRSSIADSWLHLLDRANSSVHIAAFYVTLRGSDAEFAGSSDSQGQKVFEHLKGLESKGVKLQIAVNGPQTSTKDTLELAATGAEVREVDLKALTGGIVHTKLLVVDQKHFYVGSANMDWRSLSQVKEVGLWVEDCSCLAQDSLRIFEVYWSVSNGSLPPYFPARLSALSSAQEPLQLKFNGVPARVYLSSAPPQISARGRSDDLTAILSVINDAQKFVYVSVMDYLPMSQFTDPIRYWPDIDSALRAAACARGVEVRLMISCWEHSPAAMFTFLQSLLVLQRPPLKCNIDLKIFTVPSTAEQKKIPFARVNHAKFMVTDRVVYIGTSNWSESYFTQTAGVGLVVNQTGSLVGDELQTLQSEVEELFLRDWTSAYASPLSVDSLDVCPRHGR